MVKTMVESSVLDPIDSSYLCKEALTRSDGGVGDDEKGERLCTVISLADYCHGMRVAG